MNVVLGNVRKGAQCADGSERFESRAQQSHYRVGSVLWRPGGYRLGPPPEGVAQHTVAGYGILGKKSVRPYAPRRGLPGVPPRASRTAGHQCPPQIRSAAELAIWRMVTASVSHEECDATHRIATGQHLMIELEVPGPMHAFRQSRKGRARKALCETRNIRGLNLVCLRVLGASVPPRSVHSSSSSKITLRFFCASTSIF